MGNSHAKEIVVDRKIHMSGSHNWLSYRGDRLPRGETVHQVTNTDLVQEAYEFLVTVQGVDISKLRNQQVAARLTR